MATAAIHSQEQMTHWAIWRQLCNIYSFWQISSLIFLIDIKTLFTKWLLELMRFAQANNKVAENDRQIS